VGPSGEQRQTSSPFAEPPLIAQFVVLFFYFGVLRSSLALSVLGTHVLCSLFPAVLPVLQAHFAPSVPCAAHRSST
jgi:hypothetical protein